MALLSSKLIPNCLFPHLDQQHRHHHILNQPLTLLSQPVDPAANFASAETAIRKAAAAGCHIAILPEYHLTSWVPQHKDFVLACAESEKFLPRYQALARELNISIVPGTICESHPATEHAPEPEDERVREILHGKELRNMAHVRNFITLRSSLL